MVTYTGKIIYWNGIYGFISYDDDTIFFHRSSLVDKDTHLLEKVSFLIEINRFGVHSGKKIAVSVKHTGDKTDLNEYNRFVGVLGSWDNKRGIISSPQQKLPIHFIYTRKLYLDDTFQNNDLVVFHPVKSTRHDEELFALFVYHINRETDITFLQSQYVDSRIEQINYYIDKLAETKVLTSDEKLIIKISRLSYVENPLSYAKLTALLKESVIVNQNLILEALRKQCKNVYLIQLFEAGLIEAYDLEVMKNYFHNSLADNKRYLINRIKGQNKELILQYHIDSLRDKGLFEYVNDEIKTLLDIVYRNPQTRNTNLYSTLKTELLNKLDPIDLIDLWLSDYIDELSEAFLISEFDIKSSKQFMKLLNKEGDKFEIARKRIFESYFANFNNKHFEKELGTLTQALREFERFSKERYDEIISIYNSVFDNYQKFLLWIFGVKNIDFKFNEVVEGQQDINDYYKLKYLLRCKSEQRISFSSSFEKEISFEGLISFIKSNPWNEFIYPLTNNEEEYVNINSFLYDVETIFANNPIDVRKLAEEIFESMPKYNAHHIRLWLYNWVDNGEYDYVGFRQGFKELTKEEQKKFRERGDSLIKGEVTNKISNDIKSCKKIIDSTQFYKVYSACLYNLFFQEGTLKLKKEDESFTKPYAEALATRAFNDIPESNSLNKIEVKVTVDMNNNITRVEGLDLIFNTIHTKQIEKALGVVVEPRNRPANDDMGYVEDWKLIKKIKDFLSDRQFAGIEVKLVHEPKNFFRRLDEKSGIDKYELTALFTLEAPCDFAIVWDNVDYSQDRAIYVFKTKYMDLESQLHKIADAIASTAQFRSTLISLENDEMYALFKANLGYVGNIRKNKGELYSFEKFQQKLEKLFCMPTPVLPTPDEQLKLDDWNPETPHTGRVRAGGGHKQHAGPRQMHASEIGKVDISFYEKAHLKTEKKEVGECGFERKEKIYNMLRSFNEVAVKIYNIE